MFVLLTGACGNLGIETLKALLESGHRVRTFDIGGQKQKAVLAPYLDGIETVWGDVTEPADVAQAVEGVDAILHNAAITPPQSELKPLFAYRVNVSGTKNLLDAAKAQARPPRFLFTSSIAVFGITQPETPPPRRADARMNATDHYSAHKIDCEEAIRSSGLTYCIFRVAASPPADPRRGNLSALAFMFERSLDSRVEYVHPSDVAHAEVRALEVEAAWNKVLLIGGGKHCQIRNHDLINGMFEAMGMGKLPAQAFSSRYLYGDWLDTEESERLLHFQRHSHADFLEETRAMVGRQRVGMKLLAPLLRRFLLRYSPTYSAR
jgi:nucleoside-diphosphate-sugar epimerase